MSHRFQRTSLAPEGFAVDAVNVDGESVQIHLLSNAPLRVMSGLRSSKHEFRAGIYVGPQTCRLVADVSS